jgi:hypothetical protein
MRKTSFFLSTVLALVSAVPVAYGKDKLDIKIPIDEETKKYSYSEVLEIPGVDAHELYQRSKDFSIRKSSDQVFLIDEIDSKLVDPGDFSVNGIVKKGMLSFKYNYLISYTLSTLFKDGKCKYELTNFRQANAANRPLETYTDKDEAKGNEIIVNACCAQIDSKSRELIGELKKALANAQANKDW